MWKQRAIVDVLDIAGNNTVVGSSSRILNSYIEQKEESNDEKLTEPDKLISIA